MKNQTQFYSPPARSCFYCITVEICVGQREVFGVGAQELGEHRLLLVPLHVIVDVAVHESIHQRGVGMQVDVEVHVMFLVDICGICQSVLLAFEV